MKCGATGGRRRKRAECPSTPRRSRNRRETGSAILTRTNGGERTRRRNYEFFADVESSSPSPSARNKFAFRWRDASPPPGGLRAQKRLQRNGASFAKTARRACTIYVKNSPVRASDLFAERSRAKLNSRRHRRRRRRRGAPRARRTK